MNEPPAATAIHGHLCPISSTAATIRTATETAWATTILNAQMVPVYIGAATVTVAAGFRLDPGAAITLHTTAAIEEHHRRRLHRGGHRRPGDGHQRGVGVSYSAPNRLLMPMRHSIDTMTDSWLASLASEASAVWPSANLAIYVPLRIPSRVVVRKLWFASGTTGTGNVDMALFDAAGVAVVSATNAAKIASGAEQVFDVTDTTVGCEVYFALFFRTPGILLSHNLSWYLT